MKIINNPFELFSYQGPAYFCDREEELSVLQEAFDNRRNLVLYSSRRLGKTSLIQHWHHHLEKTKKTIPIYIDVLDTTSDEAFINKLMSAIFQKLQEKENLLSVILDKFQSVRPKIGVDPSTGMPTVTLSIQSDQDVNYSLAGIFNLLTQRKENIQLAFDEFQQIANYDSTKTDATIRSFYPAAKNIHFMYLGSEKHLLQHLFMHSSMPMFSTVQMLHLDYIGYAPYFDFIKEKFMDYGKEIADLYIHEILTWTRRHTFYTHFLCNQVFSKTKEKVTKDIVSRSKDSCLKQFEANYLYYQKILSPNQWKLLKAIAKERSVQQFFGKDFLSTYRLSASSTRQSLNYLIKNQLVDDENTDDGISYFVNDVFLSRWLENKD